MDSAQQANGEKRVRDLLIKPLERRGLIKPTGMTKPLFEEMQVELCAKLAYMSDLNLMALEEDAAGMAGGKDKDRFPIANKILPRAAGIQPPEDDASPLIRAVFAHPLGRDAIDEGWAPELLKDLRVNRQFPKTYAANRIREQAGEAVRRMTNLDDALARGAELTAVEQQFRSRRLAALGKCRRISQMGSAEGGE